MHFFEIGFLIVLLQYQILIQINGFEFHSGWGGFQDVKLLPVGFLTPLRYFFFILEPSGLGMESFIDKIYLL